MTSSNMAICSSEKPVLLTMNKSVTRRMTVARWRRFCFVMASSSSSIRVCDIVALASSRATAAFCASARPGDVAILCGIVSYSRD